ncbi:MAG: hypothetical protein V1922_00120 [bacterium]
MGLFSPPGGEIQVSGDKQPKLIGTHIASNMLQTAALIERHHFLENIYYRGVPQASGKPFTNEMRQVVLEPLGECVNAPPNNKNGEKGDKKTTSSLTDWQARKAPHLSYKEFKTLVSDEARKDTSIDQHLLLQEYIIRSLSESLHLVEVNGDSPTEDIQRAAHQAIGDTKTSPRTYTPEQSKHYMECVQRVQKSAKIVGQMQMHGVDNTRLYYRYIQEIQGAVTPRELDIAKNNIYSVNVGEYKEDLRLRANEKKQTLIKKSEHEDIKRVALNPELSADMLNRHFKSACDYLSSLIPKKDRRIWDKAPYGVLKLATALRRVLPVENAEILAQMWWQLRLGGARAKDIYEHLKTEWPEFVKKHKLERYTEHLADNFLSSEAAGFELQKNISIPEGVTPNQLLFQTMKDLIHHHIPKNQTFVRFTLLDGENKVKKITIPYHEGITDADIAHHISSAISATEWKTCHLTDRERATLSYKGYSVQERKKDPLYAQIYRSFGVNPYTRKEYEGDYIIQAGSPHTDTRDPRSLFAVDSHKAAIQLQFNVAGKVNVTTRYSHPHFDGVPAQKHNAEILKGLASITAVPEVPPILSRAADSFEDFLKESVVFSNKDALGLPLIEARADYNDALHYTKQILGPHVVLTPVDIRSLVLARANGIEYFQQLVAGKAEGTYFVRNPNSNNVQPVVVVSSELNKKNAKEWVGAYRKAVDRSKSGVGDAALFSAITGTRETPLAYMGGVLNPRVTNMLTHAQGMISTIPGGEMGSSFTTAISNAYRPANIDLNAPLPSMGAIGILSQKEGASHYTVRLLPSQAQVQFRDGFVRFLPPHATVEQQRELLTEFSKIIKAWDKLVGGNGTPISLDEYETIRNGVMDSLHEKGLLDGEQLAAHNIGEGKSLQVYMNGLLQKATRDVFNEKKMVQSQKELYALLGSR